MRLRWIVPLAATAVFFGVGAFALAHARLSDTTAGRPSPRWQELRVPDESMALAFTDREHGLLIRFGQLGDALVSKSRGVYVTADGGKSWTRSRAPIIGHAAAGLPDTVATLDSPQSIDLTGGGLWLVYQGPRSSAGYHAGVLRSTDGGRTWRVGLTLPSPTNVITNTSFVGSRYGWVAYVNDRDRSTRHMTLLRTRNGGETWQRVTPRGEAQVLPADRMQFADAGHGYLFNVSNGTLWRTSDGGASWRASSPPDAGTELSLYAVDAGKSWLAVGNWPTEGSPDLHSGALYSSADGGATWRSSGHFADVPLNDVWFADRRHGWVDGEDGHGRAVLYATGDGGGHWHLELDLGKRGSVEGFLMVGHQPFAWVHPDASWNSDRRDYLYSLN